MRAKISPSLYYMNTALPGSSLQVSDASFPSTVSEFPLTRVRETSKCLPPTLHLTILVAPGMVGREFLVRGDKDVVRSKTWRESCWDQFSVNFHQNQSWKD